MEDSGIKQADVKVKKPKKLPLYDSIASYKSLPENDDYWPGAMSPLCLKCGFYAKGNAKTPFMHPTGSESPVVTLVAVGPSKKEDDDGRLGSFGVNSFVAKAIADIAKELKVEISGIRYAPTSLCCAKTTGNPATASKWCVHHLYEDLKAHTPKVIIPIGSKALGVLNHKSNAQDWGGKLLTYRGWPDDWLINEKFENGHPLYGARPTFDQHIPMVPIQDPKIVYGSRNPVVISRWRNNLKHAISVAINGHKPLVYDRPWWKLTEDPNEVAEACLSLISNPGTVLTYDTETTGLYPFDKDKIVFMMFRWNDPVTGEPKSLGWPWNYSAADAPKDCQVEFQTSAMLPHIEDLAPVVLEALSVSKLRGHNLTFDLLFTIATLPNGRAYLDRICEAFYEDTWHMRYCLRQEKGSIGLEILAYDWAKSLAGYEEEFTLLIDRYPEMLHPKFGGHYANCPKKFWQSGFRPYVMGDVEVCKESADSMNEALSRTVGYKIPLADTEVRGKFRKYQTVSRKFVYERLMSPAGSALAKLMGRGMYVNADELESQEKLYPKMVFEAKENLRKGHPELDAWCNAQERIDPEWEFDLGKADILKTALFDVMKLPIVSLTEAGEKAYGTLENIPKELRVKFASTDKYSLNFLASKHKEVLPLLSYRSLHKLYSSYVRPLRNITTPGLDKKPRSDHQLLMADGCVHTQFKIAGTRTGRLSSSSPNLQQIPREGLIKKLFSSRFKQRGCIYQSDLSQIELRLLAAACGDPKMVDAYWKGIDLHSLTTSLVFKIPYENFGDEYEQWCLKNGKASEFKKLKAKRKIGKILNFLTGYGGGALGFQSALALAGIYLQLEECEDHINNFFDVYSYLKTHIGHYKQFVLENGRAVSITGRVRMFDEVKSDDFGQVSKATRAGYNHLIQATASDMMLVSIIAIEQIMRSKGLESILVSTVHDSLVVDAVKSEVPAIHEIVDSVLSNIPDVMQMVLGDEFDTSWAIVPFSADSAIGKDYSEEFKIGKNVDWDKLFNMAGMTLN